MPPLKAVLDSSEDCGTHGTHHGTIIEEGSNLYCFTCTIFEFDGMDKWDCSAAFVVNMAIVGWSSGVKVNRFMLSIHCYMQIAASIYQVYDSSLWGHCFIPYNDLSPFPSSRTTSLTSTIPFLLYGPRMWWLIACHAPSLPLMHDVSLSGTGHALLPCPCMPHLKHSPEQMLVVPRVSGYGMESETCAHSPCCAIH